MTDTASADYALTVNLLKRDAPSAEYAFDGKLILSPALKGAPGLVHGSTTRTFQANLPAGISRVDEMRAACAMLGLDNYGIAWGEQKHTNNVAVVQHSGSLIENHQVFPTTDALVTAEPGQVLVIQTADCAPVYLYDAQAGIIGLAHGGWKGTLARISEMTVDAMEQLGASASNITAWIGPMACRCCYEVSQELVDAFTAEFSGDAGDGMIASGRHLDLVEINRLQLIKAGLKPENVHLSGICTIHQNDQFFSYRADNRTTGRILSVIAMQRR